MASPDLQISPSPPPPPASVAKISPAVLFTIVIIAFLFFISGVLHLLVRLLTKHPNPSTPSVDIPTSQSLQRQLQQLFNLHDSGLDQSLIDALPVFSYSEIVGPKDKEPFDCAVCLSEFSDNDKLRVLPSCTHAFHLNCIDTWLLSNSTCPLCRSALFLPVSDDDHPIFSVRLGKFRRSDNEVEIEEASSSCLDARRCYSMGSYQYVVGNTHLRVALCPPHPRPEINNVGNGDGFQGNKIASACTRDSYSVSKIWLWQNKGGLQSSSRDSRIDLHSLSSEFPWINENA